MSHVPVPVMARSALPSDSATIIMEKDEKWYIESRFFWSIQEPTVEAMCQGVGEVSTSDLRYTFAVLSLLKSEDRIKGGRVADCGGGIGRVSEIGRAHV